MKKSDEVLPKLKEFVEFKEHTASSWVLWDSLKAFLRGILIQQVVKIKKESREWEESIRKEVIEAENNYVNDPTLEKQKIWLNKQQGDRIAIIRKVENM